MRFTSSFFDALKATGLFSLFLILFGVIYWIMLIVVDIQRLEFIPIDKEPYSSVVLKNINMHMITIFMTQIKIQFIII